MAFDRQAAKQAGYSDDEIDAYLQSQPRQEKDNGPVAPGAVAESSTEPPPPSTVIGETGGMGPALATAGMAAAPYVVPAAIAGAGIYGAAKVGGWGRDLANTAREGMEAYKYGVNANTQMATENASLQRERMLERMARNGDAAAKAELDALQQARNAKVMPNSNAQAGQKAFGQMGQQLAGAPKPIAPVAPVAPTMAPTQAAQPGMIQRGMDMASQVRQAAAQRIMPAMGQAGQAMSQAGSMFGKGLSAAAPALRVGGMASNALYSGDLNTGEQQELERRRKMSPTITR